jgi:hypothetical protein
VILRSFIAFPITLGLGFLERVDIFNYTFYSEKTGGLGSYTNYSRSRGRAQGVQGDEVLAGQRRYTEDSGTVQGGRSTVEGAKGQVRGPFSLFVK